MTFKLGHIIHFTKDPAGAVNGMKSFGLSAFIGGEHVNWGTKNGLCYFGLTYIEFLGIVHNNIAEKVSDNTLIRQLVEENKDGLARLALRVNDINNAAQHFKSLGLQTIGPIPGSRKQPDGHLLEWAMLFLEYNGPDPYRLPFIIDWKISDKEREQQLIDCGLITKHTAGDIKLPKIVLAVRNAKETAMEWRKLFDAEIEDSFKDKDLNALGTRINWINKAFCFMNRSGQGR